MDVIERLKELIKIDTTNPPGNEKILVNYLKDIFYGKADLIEIEHDNDRSSLIVRFVGKSSKIISIVGHMDTVPTGEQLNWKFNPLIPKVDDDFIYGRGTSDMKSGLACMISLGVHLYNNYKELPITIDLVFTADEETGGKGVKEIKQLGYFDNSEFILVPEPTSLNLGVKEKGALWLSVIVSGKSAHGAYPENGVNAINGAYIFYHMLEKFINNSPRDDLLNKSTVSLNKIEGGNKVNIVADKCSISLDIRYTTFFKREDILMEIKEIIDNMCKEGYKIEYDISNDRPAIETDMNSKYITDFKTILRNLNISYDEVGIYYYTDASDIVPNSRTPFLLFGPGFENECHKGNEKASISNIRIAEKVYNNWINLVIKNLNR